MSNEADTKTTIYRENATNGGAAETEPCQPLEVQPISLYSVVLQLLIFGGLVWFVVVVALVVLLP